MALDLPERRQTDVPIENVAREGAHLRFDLPRGTAVVHFSGELANDAIAGTVTMGDQRGAFDVVRAAPVRRELLDEYSGNYRLPNGDVVFVVRSTWPYDGLAFETFPSSRLGLLFPVSDTTFIAGPSNFIPYPPEIRAQFTRDGSGRVASLRWQNQVATRFEPYTTREVRFENGDVPLAGTLYVPATQGPHPGVVLIHGSDPDTRFTGAWPRLFALHGFAVLTYDKRANWRDFTFHELAADAEAGLRFLRQQPEVDAPCVGLWAISQGGWVAPIVGTRVPDLAFIILHAGAPVTPRRQAQMELEQTWPARGYSDADIREALAYQALYTDAMRSDEAWEKLQQAYADATARGARWVWNPGTKERLRANWFGKVADFDVTPYLEKLKMPILAFFGTLDPLVPAQENSSVLESTLQRSGHPNYTIRILPRANHTMQVAITGIGDRALLTEMSPEYYSTMFAWLHEVVATR